MTVSATATGTRASEALFAYVGCYTTDARHARGDGINVFRVDPDTGRWSHMQCVSGLTNPSFLAVSQDGRSICTIHGDASEITSFAVDPTSGHLDLVCRQDTKGVNPVHVAFDPTGTKLVVPNHWTSTVVLLPFSKDTGAVGDVCDQVTLEGAIGPHRVEQQFAKPHHTEFDPTGRFVYVPDKGLDRVFSYRIEDGRKLVPTRQGSVVAREGAGPRHIAFHPTLPFAFVVNELDSTVTVYDRNPEDGTLIPKQIVPSVPDSFTGTSRAAEIAVLAGGRYLIASNRGADLLSVFSVSQNDGRLTLIGAHPSGGKTPRFFTTDPQERFLYAANEGSDVIVQFRFDASTGALEPTGYEIAVKSPVSIVFVRATDAA